MLAFFTVANPLEQLDDGQLRWHTDRAIDLSQCALLLEVADATRELQSSVSAADSVASSVAAEEKQLDPTAENVGALEQSEDASTLEIVLVGGDLPSGKLTIRCDSVEERQQWCACLSQICRELSPEELALHIPESITPEPQPEPEPEPARARTRARGRARGGCG